MDRTKHVELADEALIRAERHAGDAERHARSDAYNRHGAPSTAIGALWADIARTHLAIAQALPETENTNG
ncbi:hypothetical protein ACFY20_08950 [Streptomyces sp. NPDC001312]|uniref:hypothetical protein n=1 Tax=Streptomyces sp. NPDC001312 TaxID=3364561 RepID=UPI003683B689